MKFDVIDLLVSKITRRKKNNIKQESVQIPDSIYKYIDQKIEKSLKSTLSTIITESSLDVSKKAKMLIEVDDQKINTEDKQEFLNEYLTPVIDLLEIHGANDLNISETVTVPVVMYKIISALHLSRSGRMDLLENLNSGDIFNKSESIKEDQTSLDEIHLAKDIKNEWDELSDVLDNLSKDLKEYSSKFESDEVGEDENSPLDSEEEDEEEEEECETCGGKMFEEIFKSYDENEDLMEAILYASNLDEDLKINILELANQSSGNDEDVNTIKDILNILNK